MLQGFKDFVMRGNVVDLAVGVAVGVAFTTLVTAFGHTIINPLVQALGGGSDIGLGFKVNGKTVDIGGLINAFITFFITLAVIYFAIVVPVNKMKELTGKGGEVDSTPPDIKLLGEIRDLLARR